MSTLLVDKPGLKLTPKTTSVFKTGSYAVHEQTVDPSNPSNFPPPKQLLIISPTSKGEYPVIVFLHGFSLNNYFYKQLLTHIASHGYIAIAPQLYTSFPMPVCNGYKEINSAADVTNWLSQGLESMLPKNVKPNLEKLALSGHSRGGKTAFSLALEPDKTSPKFKALIGVDPVAGFRKGFQIKPNILSDEPGSLDIGFPVMVIGTGLGGSCAPEGVNHDNFYNNLQHQSYHFVACENGHMDMLDDGLDIVGKIKACLCKAGKTGKDRMRRCVGGLVVAFLRNCMDDINDDLEAIFLDPNIAPVKLSHGQFKP
ncbi:chlorophyllase [Ranunculus cassubicifolius]